MSEIDERIAEGIRIEYAAEDGVGCGSMLFYGILCFLAFVVLPIMMSGGK